MYKRILLILLTVIFLFAGAASGSAVLTIVVQDASNNYAPLADAGVELAESFGNHIGQLTTDSAGKVQFSAETGTTYAVTVEKTGYVTQTVEKTVSSGETEALAFVYLARETPLTVIVKDTDGSLVPNAQIYIDNVCVGTTDASGYAQISVTRDKSYAFAVKHPSYEDFNDTITVGSEPSETIYLIKKDVAPYFFVTDTNANKVGGATVSISGTAAAVTNSEGIAALPSSSYSGTYPVSVSKDGYEAWSGDITITSGKTEYDIVLTPLVYSVTVSVTSGLSPVSGAKVYIDEKLVAYSAADGKAEALGTYSAGTHVLLVSAEGFAPIEQMITVNALNTAFTVDLSKTTIPVTIVVKEGDTPVANAAICIDGVTAGVTNEAGIFAASYDIGKTIQITAVKDGYSCNPVSYTTVNGENTVSVVVSPDVPVIVIALAALAVIVVVLAAILVVTAVKKRTSKPKSKKKGKSGGKNSFSRDFL